MSNQDTDATDGSTARGGAKIKAANEYSHRVTPPKNVREAVDMQPGEPWGWYWYEDDGNVYVQRAEVDLSSVPDAVNVGVAQSRRNGKYIDFAVPPRAVDMVGMEAGQPWEFVAIDGDTMVMEPRDDDWYFESADQQRLASEEHPDDT